MTQRMLPRDTQLANEYTFSRKFIDGYILKEIESNPDMIAKVNHGVQLLTDWLAKDHGYASKNHRLAQLADIDLEELVKQLFVGVAYCQTPELFTSVTAMLAGRVKFDDKADSILTVAEIMSVLCLTDAFDIIKGEASDSLVIQSNIPLSDQLLRYVVQSGYLPPMVCEPEHVSSNYDSGYLTHNDCLILGKANGHSGDICLDVINKQNSVALKLDLDFLKTVEEEPAHDLDTPEKAQQWAEFKRQSYQRYLLIAQQGNQFWLTNKVDKRGRLYSQGYHITTQGSGFKKAMIEFAEEEIVEGVPDAWTT
ncbi:hypothetical protein [uncultured Marinobacter sp.]|uniref:hypothetical protein n=1 Tax=uncultured Marinobacter sp. TaxID=187379 RepID=UPI002596AF23|nr:hypothetical protein [uncultured Marinobacter sp.]